MGLKFHKSFPCVKKKSSESRSNVSRCRYSILDINCKHLSFRSFDFCIRWKLPMYPRQSSRIRKGSKEEFQGSPSPNEPIYHKWMKKKKRALRKTKVDDSGANTDDERDCEVLDIDSTQQKHVKKDEGWFARVDDEGVDLSDEDCGSVSSISSGPSALDSSNSRKQWLSQGFCSSCWNLYKKAKKMKAPIKNKLDNGEWSHCWRKKC